MKQRYKCVKRGNEYCNHSGSAFFGGRIRFLKKYKGRRVPFESSAYFGENVETSCKKLAKSLLPFES